MKSIKGLAVLGLVLTVVGIIGVVLTYSYELETVVEEKQMEHEDFDSINLDTTNAKVEIIAINDDEPAKVELSGTKSVESQYKYDVNVVDGTLFVEFNVHQAKLYSFDFRPTSLTLKVYIPEKEYETLHVTNGNGKINLNHLYAKDINLTTSNGLIVMEDITGSQLTIGADNGKIKAQNLTTDNVQVTANNGWIDLTHVEASKVISEADNGKITMDGVTGDIKGRTNNGKISLATEDLERAIEFEADNGIINIVTEEKPENVRFEVNVDNGKVDILGEYNGSTTIGNGDNLIKLTVNNGAIVVK